MSTAAPDRCVLAIYEIGFENRIMTRKSANPRGSAMRFASIFPQLVQNIEWANACDFSKFSAGGKLAPIFVIGSPRSGTTLVGKCLGAHPQIACADESTFMLNLWHLYSCWFKGQNSRQWKPLEGFVDEQTLLDSTRVFAESVFRSLAARQSKRVPLDHTPWYTGLVPFLAALFPKAKFVHVIRDGRAVAASLAHNYKSGRKWSGANVEQRAQLWSTLVQAGMRGRTMAAEGRYFELRYESLCQEPVRELSKLLPALGLPYSDEVLKPLAVAHAGPSRPNAVIGKFSKNQLVVRAFDQTTWPAGWGREMRARFLAVAAQPMRELGYLA